MKRVLLLWVALAAILSAQAQRTISGKVIDSEQKEAIILQYMYHEPMKKQRRNIQTFAKSLANVLNQCH